MTRLAKLLYVDDETSNTELMHFVFRKKFEVVTTESPEKALEIIKTSEDIDAVISDMKMPVMNGLELINEAIKINSSIPYFIFSGYDLNPEIHEAIHNGVIKGFFQKPINVKLMTETLNKYIV